MLAAVLLVLAAAVWFGRPHYEHYKEHRDAAQARSFLAQGDYRSALLSARQTLLLNPANVTACRVMAALADLAHSPTVLDWQKRIVETEPTVENKLQLAAAALRYQNPPFPLTVQILEELNATNLAGYQVVAASLALSTRQLADAESHFEAAARLEPTNRLYELNLAIIRLGGTNADKLAASRQVLEKMRTDTNLGPAALRSLVADRLAHQDAAAANDYSTQLLVSPQATLADRLQQLGILQQLKSDAFTARLQAVQQTAATDAPAVTAVAAWMAANHLLTEDINWLTHLSDGVRSQPQVRLALADAYLQNDDWQKLRDFASHGSWNDLEFLRLAIVSRAWSQLGNSTVGNTTWDAAVSEAGNRVNALTTLLGLTEQWKLPREREALLQLIVKKFPRERQVQQALAQFYYDAGNTLALHQLYARLFGQFPNDARIKNDLTATALLLKTNLTQAGQWAAEDYAQSPTNAIAASTYALALHLQGHDQDGLAVLQKLKPAQLEQPSIALYYGILLAATGKNAEAAAYFQIAQTQGRLLPEEKQLLTETLAK